MIKKVVAFSLFSILALCMFGFDEYQEPPVFRCGEDSYVCGTGDYAMCCKVGMWCCQYRNSPQFYCSPTKSCEYGNY